MRTASVSQAVFAATMTGVGILGLVRGDLTVVWQPVPKAVPAGEVLAYFSAFISAVSGIGLLWRRSAILAARVLLAYLLLWLLMFRVPGLLRGITVDAYWSICKTAVMLAAAWVIYVWVADDWDRQHLSFITGERGLSIARALYGLAIIPFGLAHFQYVGQTASLVPGWLPGHVALAYFTGATFIAAGVAVLIGVYARLAAALSVVQMGLFLVLVWVPRVATRSLNSFQRGEVLITWVLIAGGWVVADSYRGVSWFGLAKPLAARSAPMNQL
jgi:uncharacterized membrane protein